MVISLSIVVGTTEEDAQSEATSLFFICYLFFFFLFLFIVVTTLAITVVGLVVLVADLEALHVIRRGEYRG